MNRFFHPLIQAVFWIQVMCSPEVSTKSPLTDVTTYEQSAERDRKFHFCHQTYLLFCSCSGTKTVPAVHSLSPHPFSQSMPEFLFLGSLFHPILCVHCLWFDPKISNSTTHQHPLNSYIELKIFQLIFTVWFCSTNENIIFIQS